jgi:hypothetical protein
VALGADIVSVGAQQFRALSAVRVMTGGASLSERGLVQHLLILLLGLIDVTIQADVDGIGLGKCGRPSGVRVVAIGAVALRSGMLELRLLNSVSLIRVTSDADVPDLRLRQYDFSVLGRFVADFAEFFAKGRMHESLHQLGLRRLVRVVTGYAVGFGEGLPRVCLYQFFIVRVVAIKTECGRRLRQMKCKFWIRPVARFVRDVAGIATQIEGLMPASTLGRIESRLVTIEAKVLGRCRAGRRLQEVIRFASRMRIVTGEAITRGLIVNVTSGRAFLVGVACKAKPGRSGREQFDARDVFGNAYFVTAKAVLFRSRVRVLVLRLILVASDARGGRNVRIKRSRMLLCDGGAG